MIFLCFGPTTLHACPKCLLLWMYSLAFWRWRWPLSCNSFGSHTNPSQWSHVSRSVIKRFLLFWYESKREETHFRYSIKHSLLLACICFVLLFVVLDKDEPLKNRQYSSATQISGRISTLKTDFIPMWSIPCKGLTCQLRPDLFEHKKFFFAIR